MQAASDPKPATRNADRLSRLVVYAHLSGALAFALASYLDRSPPTLEFGPYVLRAAITLGEATFLLCPLLAVWLSATGRLSPGGAAIVLGLTALIEALQVFAGLPLVQ